MLGTAEAIIVGRQPLFVEGVALLMRTVRPNVVLHKVGVQTSPEELSDLKAKIILFCCAGVNDKPDELLARFANQPEAEYEKIVVFCPLVSTHMRTIFAESGILVLPLAVDLELGAEYLDDYFRAPHFQVEYKAAGDKRLLDLYLPDFDALTAREKEVLLHVSQGYSNADIAVKMEIHINTVKVHVQKICRKIGVQNRTEAASNYSRLLNAGYS